MSKDSKQRDCPAIGRKLTPAECGEHRGSRYACRADCPHNPLAPANYSELLALGDILDKKSMRRTLDHVANQAKLLGDLPLKPPSDHHIHAFVCWWLFFQQDADGLTCAQRWEREGFPGLKNDERVLMRAKMQTRIALLEVHRVLDSECIELVDLWEPERGPFVVRDRSLARVAVRFAVYVTWCYPLPHFAQMTGPVIVLPEMGEFEPAKIVSELVQHLGGPSAPDAMRRWLAEHLAKFEEAMHATTRARWRQTLEQLDAQDCKATYELKVSFKTARRVLDGEPDVQDEPLTEQEQSKGFSVRRVWFDDAPAIRHGLPEGGRQVLGRMLLGPGQCQIKAGTAEALARLRERFEKRLGRRVRFLSESRDDLARQMLLKQPDYDACLVPPRLLEDPRELVMAASRIPASPSIGSPEECVAKLMLADDRDFPNSAIPALNGRTPREAAADPELRPALIRLLKQRVHAHDERNLRSGRCDDINWLLRELGVTEILFDAPPPRHPPTSTTDESTEEDLGEDNWDNEEMPELDLGLPEVPALPVKPLTEEETCRRLESTMERLRSPDDFLRELAASGATLLEELNALTEDVLSDDEFSFIVPIVVQLWFVMVPCGYRAPEVHWKMVKNDFEGNLEQLIQSAHDEKPDTLERFLKSARQPALMIVFAGQLYESIKLVPKKIRPQVENYPVMLALLKAVSDELDQALRR